MTVTTAPKRKAVAARRAGYSIALAVNAAMLFAVNAWPGWEALPFLTADAAEVMGWVNASIIVNLAANVAYLLRDPPWLRALGDVVTITVGLIAVVWVLRVFPFDFGGSDFDWALVVRILLVLGIVGSAIGIVAALVTYLRTLAGRSSA